MFKPGLVIAYPTETSYGLGCDPRDTKAVKRIFHIKGREKHKPVLLIASSMKQVMQVMDVSRFSSIAHKIFRQVAKKYWPGPVTLIVPVNKDAKLSSLVAPHAEVAIRITSSAFARALAKQQGFPIVSTSANKSGKKECRSARAIRKAFSVGGPMPDIILDDGALPRRIPSTIARIQNDGSIEIIRQGAVKLKLDL